MLKFKLKPTGSFGVQEINCYSMYVSPDLTYISGRTSYYNSILNGEKLKVVNNENKFVNLCKVNAENVKVQGKVKLETTLKCKLIEKKFINDDGSFINCQKNYVEYNGVFSYEHDGRYLVEGKLYKANDDGDVAIATFSYIENGTVKIGDKEYIADFREGGKPKILEKRGADPLKENDTVGDYTYKGVEEYLPKEWKRETKFEIYKEGDYELTLDDVLFGGYDHYIIYNGENYYLKNLYNDNGEYVGYGVEIDGVQYTNLSRQIYDGEGILPYDNLAQLQGSILMLSENEDDYYIVQDKLISPKNNGNFLFLAASSQRLNLKVGDTVIAKSNGLISTKLEVLSDNVESEDADEYVIYLGVRYDVKKNAYKRINVSDSYHMLIEEKGDGYDAYAYFGSEKIYYTIEGDKAIPTNKIYYGAIKDDEFNVEYGLLPDGYTIETYDGVIIGNDTYMVYREVYDDIIEYAYIEITEDATYNLAVTDKSGSNLYICYPEVSNESLPSDYDIATTRRFICDTLVRNKDNFTFYIRNDVFGEKPIYPDTYLYDAVTSTKPFYTAEKLNLSIFKINSYANFKLPMVDGMANNILRDDIIRNDFAKSISDKSLTDIVDMEKDIYYPVYKSVEGDEVVYNPINCIRFNMHFRTRQMDNWKVIEDYVEDESNRGMSNWFVTDYDFYKNALIYDSAPGNETHTLHNASDLIGFLGFTDSEVRNRGKKIGKSFLRLSFYSTNNPQTQVLLNTSTIFMDDALLCKKMISLQPSANAGQFIDVSLYQSPHEGFNKDYISVFTESCENGKDNCEDSFHNFEKNEYFRLSSRIEVYDRHTSIGSSEGFYFYMFREYANNLRPLRIYLRIDFNHAGIGKTIPLIIPRKNIKDDNEVGEPLYIHNDKDLEVLKEGFKLKDIYKQLFIPIDVIFDDKTNRYVYYLPNELRENTSLKVDDDIMEFNLFEVKFKDESIVEKNESNQ